MTDVYPFPQNIKPRDKPPVLVAAAALIDGEGRVLLSTRPKGKHLSGLWEFPGGKVGMQETPEAALIRELKEELDIDTAESCLAPLTFSSYDYEAFHLILLLYVCRIWKGQIQALEGQELAWVKAASLADYKMPPADVPLIAALRSLL